MNTEAVNDAATQAAHGQALNPALVPFTFPSHWPAQVDLLTWCQQMGPGLAALLLVVGAVYLLFGYNVFKFLVVANAAVLGGVAGAAAAGESRYVIPVVITCAFAAAVVTWPLMKWAVAVMGGVYGAILGASLWRTFDMDPHFTWAGAAMGLIFLGMLSFILFRVCVMAYMSLQGAAMLTFGLLGLVYKYHDLAPKVTSLMTIKPFLLPMAILIPATLGIMFQQNNASPAGPPKK